MDCIASHNPYMLQILQVMIMVFRNRGMGLRPINRIKHVVDSQLGLVLGVQLEKTLVESNDDPVLANTNEVITGSTVNAIYLNVEAYATTAGALANLYIIVGKNPGTNLAGIAPNLVGASDNKRYVIHQEMKMLEQSVNGNPRTIFNGVIVIPKGYRRMGPNDIIYIRFLAPGVNANVCFQCHYKEFRQSTNLD